MANSKLKAWLSAKPSERNYQEGVELFKTLKVDKKKNDFFSTDEPQAIHKSMLFGALLRFNRIHGQKESAKTEAAEQKKEAEKNKINPSKNLPEIREQLKVVGSEITQGQTVIDKGLKVSKEELPEDLQEAYQFNQDNYPVIRSKFEKMKLIGADAKHDLERKGLMNEILDLQKQIKANWVKLDAYQNNPEGDHNESGSGDEFTQPTKASGTYTKEEIEQITDAVVQAQSKEKRVEANLNYLRRNMTDDKKKEEVDKRIEELKAWEIDYEARIGNNKASGSGK